MGYILAIDQGTSSTRATLFNKNAEPIANQQEEFTQIYPHSGWVEHDPEAIWATTLTTSRQTLLNSGIQINEIGAIGITNQRETTVIWDRNTGEVIHNAIVWQDRRTAEYCEELKLQGYSELIQEKTGLVLDPYFSASKIKWLLDHVPGARQRAAAGELAFGTIDSFLIWRFSKGKKHLTDATNAARTLLFNIETQQWDQELLDLFEIPSALLSTVLDSSGMFCMTDAEFLGAEIPICGVAGDQQAATVGQACLQPGTCKITYGTGAFLMLNTGAERISSQNRLLSTVAYRLHEKTTYAIEGSIFMAGAAVQWLRDKLQIIDSADETERLAKSLAGNDGVYLVPAFTGLGAPYWDPNARGMLCGLTRDTSRAHIVRATLESVCYQTRDLLQALKKDGAAMPSSINVDGGMVVNDWFLQQLANCLQITIVRATINESSSLGAALLAGLHIGMIDSLDAIVQSHQSDREFIPEISVAESNQNYVGWLRAVEGCREIGV